MRQNKWLSVLIRNVDLSSEEVRKAIREMAKEGIASAIYRLEDVKRYEDPCNKCGGRGYLGGNVDFWGCPNDGSDTCPYCNGRGYSRDR